MNPFQETGINAEKSFLNRHHRHPADNVRRPINAKKAAPSPAVSL